MMASIDSPDVWARLWVNVQTALGMVALVVLGFCAIAVTAAALYGLLWFFGAVVSDGGWRP
jgi:hypothetical protein